MIHSQGGKVATAVFLAALAASANGQEPQEWPRSTPDEAGLDAAALATFDAQVRAGEFGHVDRLVVVHGGALIWDAAYPQDYHEISRGHASEIGCGWESCGADADLHDFNYLHPDYHPWYQGRRVHSLQSVTKSVASTMIGAAIHRGDISGVDAKLVSFLGEYDLAGADPRLRQVSLADVLTMRSGIEWHEHDRPLGDTNTTIQLERSDDWVQFTLDQPMDAAPGSKWVYNSGGSHLMSAVIYAATGQTIAEYAEAHLFGPLGISDYYWKHTPMGLPDTEGGLYLDAPALARIGQLMLQDGMWNGERLLPAGWARDATARHVDRVSNAPYGYGYQWWRPDTQGTEIWAGMGFGDQYLLVLPDHDLVVVINSWNLFDRPQRRVFSGLIDLALALVD